MATDLPEYLPPSRRRIRIGQVYRDAYRNQARVMRVTRIVEYGPGQVDVHLETLTGPSRRFRRSRTDAARLGGCDFHPVLPTLTMPTQQVPDRRGWERLVRGAAIDPNVKYVGLMAATYATRHLLIQVSDRQLAKACRMGPRTVLRALSTLREYGLLRDEGSGQAGLLAYRMTAPLNVTRPPAPDLTTAHELIAARSGGRPTRTEESQ